MGVRIKTKKIFFLLCVLCIVTTVTTSCASTSEITPAPQTEDNTEVAVIAEIETPSSVESVTIKINGSSVVSFAPLYIANANGYFADEGITLDLIELERSNDALPLIITGDLDAYAGPVTSGLFNVLGQEPYVKVVADRGHIAPSDPCTYLGLIVEKGLYEDGQITGPQDLKGRNIIFTPTSPSGYFMKEYLSQAGLTFEDINILEIPATGYVDAMNNGTADGIAAPEPRLSQVLSQGNSVILSSAYDVVGNLQTSVLVFGKRLLSDEKDVGIRFLKAYVRGVQTYNEGMTDSNVATMMDFTGDSEETIRSSCWSTINNDGSIDFSSSVVGYINYNVERGDLDNPITEEQFWDPSLLQEVLSNP